MLRGGYYAALSAQADTLPMRTKARCFAVPFDLQRLGVTGKPAAALEGVMSAPSRRGAVFLFGERKPRVRRGPSRTSESLRSTGWTGVARLTDPSGDPR